MTMLSSGADVLASLPDLPRWVQARGMLLSRRGFVVETSDGCRVVCGRKDRLIVPIAIELSPELETAATREVPDGSILLQDVMLPAARFHLPDWNAEPATVYTLPQDRARSWPVPHWPTSPLSAEQLDAAAHVPQALRDRLIEILAHSPVWAASVDGQPMSFSYATLGTEAWFDVAVETLEPGRGLGRAAAMGLIVDRMLHGLRPVWQAPRSSAASHAVARRLGFEPVDLVWVLTRAE